MKKIVALLCCGLLCLGAAQAQELKPFVGDPTPPLSLADLNGKIHRLEDYRGKVVMVQFWATYCPPCIKEMPSMQRLEKKLAGKPFVILAINTGETEKEVRNFLARIKTDFTVLMDPDGKTASTWKVVVAPTTFLLDPAGNIRYSVQGGLEWDKPRYMQKIAAMLPAPPGKQ